MTEAVTVKFPSHEEDFDDVGCNADLYASRQGAFQGSSNHERSQHLTDPHCFQPLSLDYVLAAQLGCRFYGWDVINLSTYYTSIKY